MLKYVILISILHSSFAYADESTINNYNKKILGIWTCSWLIQEENNAIDLEIDTQYIRNGRFNAFGVVKYDIENKINKKERIKLDYNLAMSGSWRIDDSKYLISVVDEVKTTNITNPLIDQVASLDRFFPKGISSSSEILNINERSIITKEEGSDEELKCNKKKNKTEINKLKNSDGIIYVVIYNDDGAILNNSKGERIYIGKSCDTFSKDFGGGKWGYANDGIVITLGDKVISFPNQKMKIKGCEL